MISPILFLAVAAWAICPAWGKVLSPAGSAVPSVEVWTKNLISSRNPCHRTLIRITCARNSRRNSVFSAIKSGWTDSCSRRTRTRLLISASTGYSTPQAFP